MAGLFNSVSFLALKNCLRYQLSPLLNIFHSLHAEAIRYLPFSSLSLSYLSMQVTFCPVFADERRSWRRGDFNAQLSVKYFLLRRAANFISVLTYVAHTVGISKTFKICQRFQIIFNSPMSFLTETTHVSWFGFDTMLCWIVPKYLELPFPFFLFWFMNNHTRSWSPWFWYHQRFAYCTREVIL